MNADPLTSDWFYVKQGQSDAGRVGPVSWGRLVALAQSGELAPADSVWHQSLPGWVPAAGVAGLFAAPSAGAVAGPVAAPPLAGAVPVPGAPAVPAAAPPPGGASFGVGVPFASGSSSGPGGTPPGAPLGAAPPIYPAQPPAYPAGRGPAAPIYPAAAAPTAGRRSKLPWLIPLIAVVLVGVGLGLLFGLKNGDDQRGPVVSSTTSATTVSTAVSTTEAASSTTEPITTVSTLAGEPDTWLVMMYEDADDEILEEDMIYDVNEAELVGSTDKVTIVAQVDRYVGGYSGSGDVTSTKRYVLAKDTDLYTVTSPEVADLGELDMGDGQTLYDFATWAITSYPAQRHVLILADHGGGWTGGWSDDDPQPDSSLSMQEIDDVLSAVIADTGIGAFEMIGFDACLMGQLEVMSAVAPHARYSVASEETEPGIGWGYHGFLQTLVDDPTVTGLELGQAIVDSYIDQDIRVTDDEARATFTGGTYTAEEVAAELNRSSTLAAIDLSAVRELNAAVNSLALVLAATDQELVAQARAYSQSYASVFGEEEPPSFIDLGHFVDLLLEDSGDPQVAAAAQEVRSALGQAVVAEAHGPERPGSTGLSIYFPNSTQYDYTFTNQGYGYPVSIGRFSAASVWDDYLTYHYTGETFDAGMADLAVVTPSESTETDFTDAVEEATPEVDAEIVGPGAGVLSIAPLTVSALEIDAESMLNVSTTITGSNVAYVYYYVAYYEESDGSFLTADAGFIESGYVEEVGGIYYPDWGEGGVIEVQWDWEPTLYFMSDGNPDNDQFAFFEPTVYGSDVSTDIYTVRGTYIFADTGTEIEAEIEFNGEGYMQRVWAYIGGEGAWSTGSWYEITPRPGDSFNITDEYLEFDVNPDGEFVDYYGGTMVFGDTPFTMVPYYAYPGYYSLAIGVEDFDGNVYWEFSEVTVTE